MSPTNCFPDKKEDEEASRRRADAIGSIHKKLEKFGDFLGHTDIEDDEHSREASASPLLQPDDFSVDDRPEGPLGKRNPGGEKTGKGDVATIPSPGSQ